MGVEEKKYEYEPVAGLEDNSSLEAQYNTENGELNMQFKSNMSSEKELPSDRVFLYIAACVGNLAAFTCGTMIGWTSPELPKLKQNPQDGNNPLGAPLTADQESWIGCLLPMGATLGPFLAGYAADKIGRKKAIVFATICFIPAFIMSAFATAPSWFYAARFISGLGAGALFTVLPMYIGEISDDAVRGSLGSFMQLFITVGLLFSFIIGPYVSVRMFNIACLIVPCVFVVVFTFFIPESPHYLVRTNKDEAEKALQKLRSSKAVHAEMDEIKASVDEALKNKASFMDIFKSKGLTKALVLSVSLVSFQQLTGINIVLFFAQDIFTSAGSSIPGDISTIIIGIVQVISSGITPVLVEKKGKRFLLILSAIGMALSQATLAIFFHLKTTHDMSSFGWLPVLSLIVFIVTYCLGFGPLPWAVMGELFPGNIKSVASTVTAAGSWMLCFILTKYFSVLTDLLGKSGSFGIFATCCLVAALYVFQYLPETSGKSLQEIQEILSK